MNNTKTRPAGRRKPMKVNRDRFLMYVVTKEDLEARKAGFKVSGHKIGQRDLSRRTGPTPVSVSFINHLATGERKYCDYEIAKKICKALDVRIEDLFTPEENPNHRIAPHQRKKAAA